MKNNGRGRGHLARTGKRRGAHITVVGRLEGGKPLARPRRRMEDNISGA